MALCREGAAEGVTAVASALQTGLARFAGGVPFTDDQTLILLRRAT